MILWEQGQHGLGTPLGPGFHLCGPIPLRGHLLQLLRGERRGPAELALPEQQPAVLLVEADALQFSHQPAGLSGGAALQALQLLEPLGLATRQPHPRCQIPQVMKDGTAHVRPGEGLEWGGCRSAVKLGGPDQTQKPHLHQIVARLTGAAGVMDGQRADQIPVGLHPAVAA